MPYYHVQFEDLETHTVHAGSRQQAKRRYCNQVGLTGREDFVQPGFSIKKIERRVCKWCNVGFNGTKDQPCCNACIQIAVDDAKLNASDLLHDGLAPMEWPLVMREAWATAFADARLRAVRKRTAPQTPEPMMLPSKLRKG